MTAKKDDLMLKDLYAQILKLSTEEECAAFFEDLCTIKELQSMAQRVQAAKMLLQGKTYQEIIKETDISSATLARVSRCVRYGDGGYEKILNK
ncbi:MAG: TrpR-related protein YerC/YecD [Clostridia bacterium]|nr:TrpR-related protein YerC/YecD [Clostridia bacterium]